MDTHLSINTSGILTSPYYPSFYLNNMSRRWHLEASIGQRIHITFLFLNIEPDPKCNNDYVMIQDGATSEKQFYFCGKTLPAEFKSSSNQLLIVFKSNDKIARTGFKIRYTIGKGKGIIVFKLRMCRFSCCSWIFFLLIGNEEDGCLLADVPSIQFNSCIFLHP